MSTSHPSGATASPPQSPDVQQLVGLLGNLMPLLLQLQSQGIQPQAFQPQAFQPQAFERQAFEPQALEQPFQAGNALVPNPALERQAAEGLIGDILANSLRTLSIFLEANAALHAGLERCVPIVTQAAHRFAARDYAEAFNLIWLAYRVIETVRAVDPRVPPPRASVSEQTLSSVH